jgi:hypothetical protein
MQIHDWIGEEQLDPEFMHSPSVAKDIELHKINYVHPAKI